LRPLLRHRLSAPSMTVVPSAKDGLHCGVTVPGSVMIHPALVVPSAKDGLHCGYPLEPGEEPKGLSSRPPRTGSIAAGNSR